MAAHYMLDTNICIYIQKERPEKKAKSHRADGGRKEPTQYDY